MSRKWIFCKPKNFIFICIFSCLFYTSILILINPLYPENPPLHEIEHIIRRPEFNPVDEDLKSNEIEDFEILDHLQEHVVTQFEPVNYVNGSRPVQHHTEHENRTPIASTTQEIKICAYVKHTNAEVNISDPAYLFGPKIEPRKSDTAENQTELTNKLIRGTSQYTLESATSKYEDGPENSKVKYILQWTPSYSTPFYTLRKGRDSFTTNKCKHKNCFITNDRNYLPDQSNFDAVMFSSCELNYLEDKDLPKNRSSKQKYVFVSTEPAPKQLVLYPKFDNFFNWTWTYRLDSDIIWKYFTIYDMKGNVAGPTINMKWRDNFSPIDETLKSKLQRKAKAVAWFVSHCHQHRKRFAQTVEDELLKYGWEIDTYGKCGKYKCGNNKPSRACFKLLRTHYYFYLAFENSLDDDYVTEKVMTALDNSVVPVVYGGANYSRFLPPGSYLDAKALGPELLAKTMNNIIHNTTAYYDFFRWRNHYKYKSTWSTKEICNVCTALNDEDMMKSSVYKDFRIWWNQKKRQDVYEMIVAFHKERSRSQNTTTLKGLSVA